MCHEKAAQAAAEYLAFRLKKCRSNRQSGHMEHVIGTRCSSLHSIDTPLPEMREEDALLR